MIICCNVFTYGRERLMGNYSMLPATRGQGPISKTTQKNQLFLSSNIFSPIRLLKKIGSPRKN